MDVAEEHSAGAELPPTRSSAWREVTHLLTHSLPNEGDGVSALDTEIDTAALNPL